MTVYSAYDGSGDEHSINGVNILDLGNTFLLYEDSFGKRKISLLYTYLRRVISFVIDVDNLSIYLSIIRNKSLRKALTRSDIILTITAPHGINWALSEILEKQKKNLWIADCGDPYLSNPFVPKLYKALNKKREKSFLEKVDHISVPILEATFAYGNNSKVSVIPQGFPDQKSKRTTPHLAKRRFCYAGKIYPDKRPIKPFLNRLRNLDLQFEFHIYTSDKNSLPSWITSDKRFYVNDLTSRDEIMRIYSGMDFLVHLTNASDVQVGSKLIDYSFSGAPILEVEASSGESSIDEFLNNDFRNKKNLKVDEYRIENVAEQFETLFL